MRNFVLVFLVTGFVLTQGYLDSVRWLGTANELQNITRVDHEAITARMRMSKHIVILKIDPNSGLPSSLLDFVSLRNLKTYLEPLKFSVSQKDTTYVQRRYACRSAHVAWYSRTGRTEVAVPEIADCRKINSGGLSDVGDVYCPVYDKALSRFSHFYNRSEFNSNLGCFDGFKIIELPFSRHGRSLRDFQGPIEISESRQGHDYP